ncbi:hypothetical protein IAD21_02430 [Abditibacteriota bacterium]|nr:hypothetical protein IAD21_02430 [Abditibacteriota bacterium]
MNPNSALLAWQMLYKAVEDVASDIEYSRNVDIEIVESSSSEVIDLAIQIGAQSGINADDIRAVSEMKVADLVAILPLAWHGLNLE